MEKVAKCMLYLQCFQVLWYLFNIFKLNKSIYIYIYAGSAYHIPLTSCCAINYLFKLFKTKDLISIENDVEDEKNGNFTTHY